MKSKYLNFLGSVFKTFSILFLLASSIGVVLNPEESKYMIAYVIAMTLVAILIGFKYRTTQYKIRNLQKENDIKNARY